MGHRGLSESMMVTFNVVVCAYEITLKVMTTLSYDFPLAYQKYPHTDYVPIAATGF